MAALEGEVRAFIGQQRLPPDDMPGRAQLLAAGALLFLLEARSMLESRSSATTACRPTPCPAAQLLGAGALADLLSTGTLLSCRLQTLCAGELLSWSSGTGIDIAWSRR